MINIDDAHGARLQLSLQRSGASALDVWSVSAAGPSAPAGPGHAVSATQACALPVVEGAEQRLLQIRA